MIARAAAVAVVAHYTGGTGSHGVYREEGLGV